MSYDANETYSVDTEGRVFSGYDKPMREFYATPEPDDDDDDDDTASVADKLALADAMIARWVAYKEKVSQ